MRSIVPRSLGTLLLVISALAILNAIELFGLENYYTEWINPKVTLGGIILFLLLLSEISIYEFFKKWFTRIPKSEYFIAFLLVVLFLVIISLGFLNNRTELDLVTLFISNGVLAILFFVYAFNSKNMAFKISELYYYRGLFVVSFIAVVIFWIFNFIPNSSRQINPLSVIIISFIHLYMISFFLVLIGKKVKMPLFSYMLLLAFIGGQINATRNNFEHYEIDYVKSNNIERKPVEEYIESWLESRKEFIMKADQFPVILVSSEGGVSRAGLWSFLVHSYLYENDKNYFDRHLFSLTGESRGGVGNAMFFAKAHEIFSTGIDFSFKTDTLTKSTFSYKASELYKENYLSSSVSSLFGRDLFQNITGFFSVDNRGDLTEEEWEDAHHKVLEGGKKSLLKKSIMSFYKDDITPYVPPLLIMNTTHVQTGKYTLISPVKFKDHQDFFGYQDLIGDLQQIKSKDSVISLSSAMLLNARFPYLSPVGRIKGLGQYADAGYYDNIGGVVTESLYKAFESVLSSGKYPELAERIELIKLVIRNKDDIKSSSQMVTQLQAPLSTLLNVRSGHTQEMIDKLKSNWHVVLERTPILSKKSLWKSFKSESKDTIITPVLPLGRYLSTIAIQSMEARLNNEKVTCVLDKLLESK